MEPRRSHHPPHIARRVAVLGLAAGLALGGCRDGDDLVILHAANLSGAFGELLEEAKRRDPELDVQLEMSGSLAAARAAGEPNAQAGVVATDDVRIIDDILVPGRATWSLVFASDEIVLARGAESRHGAEITAATWPEILLRPDVRLGCADPDLSSAGYQTELVWKLAQAGNPPRPDLAARLRARCAPDQLAPDEAELAELVTSGSVDYAFLHRSMAESRGLQITPLDDALNLGSIAHAPAYAHASVAVRMKRGAPARHLRGEPIRFGLTIPSGATNAAAAERFVALLLSDLGRQALQRAGLRPVTPLLSERVDPARPLPASLAPLLGAR